MSARLPTLRRITAAAVVSLAVLTACGASAPPAKELADEMIDTMDFGLDPDTDAARIDAIRACMHQKVADFSLTDEQAQGFQNLDDVASKADGGNEQAIQILADFQAALATCP